MDANYPTFLPNTPNQAISLLHSLDQPAGGIGLHVNADKIEYVCFNQKGDIYTVNGGSHKLVDKFTYLNSSISSTENDINIHHMKACTATNRLSIMQKFDLSDKVGFLPSSGCVNSTTTWMLSILSKSSMGTAQECYEPYWTNPGNNIPKTAAVRLLTSHLLNHPNKMNKSCRTRLEK